MADPKIKYDIEASTKGAAEVELLAKQLDKLDTAFDPATTQRAEALAQELRTLGAEKTAVDNFRALKRESTDLAREMEVAAQKVDALGSQLPQTSAATTRFAEAERLARAAVAGAKADLDESRLALSKLRDEYTGAARGSAAYKESNAQLQVTIKSLRANLQEQRGELTAAAAATRQAQSAEKALTSEYNASVTAARSVSTALGTKNRALEESRAAMQQLGLQAGNLAQAERNLDAAIGTVRQELLAMAPAYRAAATASASSTQTQVQNQHILRDGMTSIASQLQRIQQVATVAIGGSFVGGLIKDVAATADEFKNLEARIKLVAGEGTQFQASFNGVADVALRTNSALNETGTLFTRIAKAGTDAGLSAKASQDQALGLTATINQSIQLSGAAADASKAAITQLVQGLQSGVLRGDEFNSVMEQAPRLAQALANGLGVTTGELRKMADQGALTSDVVIKALRGQADVVATEFEKLPPTVGRALQNLTTQWTLYVGSADKGLLSSSNAARVVDALAKNLDGLVATLYAAGKAYAAIKIAGLAGDALKWAAATVSGTTATVASTAAVVANTAATAANTTAKAANAVAAGAGGAAQATLATGIAKSAAEVAKAGLVWRGFTALMGPIGIAAVALGPEILGLAEKAGVAAARWMGWGKVLDENEAKLKAQEDAAKAVAESHRQLALATEAAAAKQFGLSKEAVGLVANFDEMRKKGDSATEAIGKIGKDFDLGSAPGILNATAVLDKLLADGKLTAAEFQAAWVKALDGKDLAQFEVTARAALSGTAREAERLQQIMEAGLREAVNRTGLEFTQLQGNVGSAARSAINDVELIVRSLDTLKAQGVDVGRVLSASIGKAIDTADSEAALTALRVQIEGLRGQLGSKITDGLLDQAKQKALELGDALDKAKPGINSVREAMKQLGITSDESLKKTAAQSKEAYDALAKDGTSSARVLSEAFVKAANDAIAANNGIAPAWVQSQAAVRGFTVEVDAAGKAVVRGMSDGKAAVEGVGKAFAASTEQIKAQEEAMDKLMMKYTLSANYTERQLALLEKENALVERRNALERQRLNIDKEGYSLNTGGQRVNVDMQTQRSVFENAKGQGLTEAQALQISHQFISETGKQTGAFGAIGSQGENWGTELQKAIDKLVLANAKQSTSAPGTNASSGGNTPNTVNHVYTVKAMDNGKTTSINVTDEANAQALVSLLQNAKLNAGF